MSKPTADRLCALLIDDGQNERTEPALSAVLACLPAGMAATGGGTVVRVEPGQEGLGASLGRAAGRAEADLLLICQHGAVPTREDLAEMRRVIGAPAGEGRDGGGQRVELVVGRRPGRRRGLRAWLRDAAFGVPVTGADDGLILATRRLVAGIPLQSRSSFATVELLAKANFMGHVLDEVILSADPGACVPPDRAARRADAGRLLSKPDFPVKEATGEATSRSAAPSPKTNADGRQSRRRRARRNRRPKR